MTNIFEDLNGLRLDQLSTNGGAVEILTHVPVRKPHRHEFVRAHHDATYVFDSTIYADKEERETYFVVPAMRNEFLGEARCTRLVTCISRQSAVFIWPLTLPGDDDRKNAWTLTALEALMHAKEHWVRLVPDMAQGCYRIFRAEGELPDPTWPDKRFEELLALAFTNRIIDDADHPIVRRLRGRI
jgi:hypothetical protein